jgi:hypothetical protein
VGESGSDVTKRGRPKGAKGTKRGAVRVKVFEPGAREDAKPIEERDVPRIDRTTEGGAVALILDRAINREGAVKAASRLKNVNVENATRLHYAKLKASRLKVALPRGRPRKPKLP